MQNLNRIPAKIEFFFEETVSDYLTGANIERMLKRAGIKKIDYNPSNKSLSKSNMFSSCFEYIEKSDGINPSSTLKDMIVWLIKYSRDKNKSLEASDNPNIDLETFEKLSKKNNDELLERLRNVFYENELGKWFDEILDDNDKNTNNANHQNVIITINNYGTINGDITTITETIRGDNKLDEYIKIVGTQLNQCNDYINDNKGTAKRWFIEHVIEILKILAKRIIGSEIYAKLSPMIEQVIFQLQSFI